MKSFASLPMYDWPEVRVSTDAFWSSLAQALRAQGLAPPDQLNRDEGESAGWNRPDLFLSQTCGLPFRLRLSGEVTLLGTPDYGLPECPPGYYRSALIALKSDAREKLADFGGASYGFNSQDSQSGYAALKQSCSPLGGIEQFLGTGVKTGAHRASVRAVARGAVELAAIDAVSWRLAQYHEADAGQVKIIGWTEPTPGLPFIAAKGTDPAPYHRAIPQAIATLQETHRKALSLKGFVTIPEAEYLS